MAKPTRKDSKGFRQIGVSLSKAPAAIGAEGTAPHPKSQAATYSELKQAWASQVARDKGLPGIALRVALALPEWLNRETLTAWPKQATIAKAVNSGERSVRAALKKLEDRDHLLCLKEKRGGRFSNRYRIILKGSVVTPREYESGPTELVTPAGKVRGDLSDTTGLAGSDQPVTAAEKCQGTPERTLEKNTAAQFAPADDFGDHRGPRVTRDQASEILREIMGPERTNERGLVVKNSE